jgi:hypothetical protein
MPRLPPHRRHTTESERARRPGRRSRHPYVAEAITGTREAPKLEAIVRPWSAAELRRRTVVFAIV